MASHGSPSGHGDIDKTVAKAGPDIDKTIAKAPAKGKAASSAGRPKTFEEIERQKQKELREFEAADGLHGWSGAVEEEEDDMFAPPKSTYAHAVLGSHPSLVATGALPNGPVSAVDFTMDRRGQWKSVPAAGVAPPDAKFQNAARKPSGGVLPSLGFGPVGGVSPKGASPRGRQADPFLPGASGERQPLLGKSGSRRGLPGGTAVTKSALLATSAAGKARDRVKAVTRAMKNEPELYKEVLATALLPWLVWFLVCSFVFVQVHANPFIAVVVPTGLGIIFLGVAAKDYYNGKRGAYIGLLTAVACAAGLLMAVCIYARYFREYYMFSDHRQYSNVWPSESAAAHRDASAIVFAEGTRVDVRLTSNFGTGLHTYCVAPITIRTDAGMPDVQYWAAGIDCCYEQTFDCGDANHPTARAGTVIRNETVPLYATIQGVHYDYYMEAARRAMERYGIVSTAEQPIFLRWAWDIEVEHRRMLWIGILLFILMAFFYLFVCFVLASGSPAMQSFLNKPTADEKEVM